MLGLLAVVAAAGGASATGADQTPTASAGAWAIRLTTGGGTTAVQAPPSTGPAYTGGFAYPGDGSVVSTGATSASASTTIGDTNAVARGSSDVSSISIFGGEITASAVSARAQAGAQAGGAAGDFNGTGVSGFQALGQGASGGRVNLGDWGYAIVNTQTSDASAPAGRHGFRGSVTALVIHLNADHGGLSAGSEIQIGHAEAAAQTAPPPPPPATTAAATTTTNTTAATTTTSKPTPADPVPADRPQARAKAKPGHAPTFREAPRVHPPLTGRRYVFPVYGPSSYSDSYGFPRADVSYHHGVDVFGQLGQPLLAVADGTIFSVGWNRLGGNRLWLRDEKGNEFYYAHLSAFSTLAVDGAHVKAGQVVGFMGNTGDAEATPYHLHFEVHPVSRLYLGYDGAVDPYPYVQAWQRLEDLPFPIATAWLAAFGGKGSSSRLPAPQAGAMLLAMSDISSADGLDPASLRRALAPPKTNLDGLPPSGVPTTVPPAGDLGRS